MGRDRTGRAGAPSGDRDAVQRALTRLYERLGSRILLVLIAITYVEGYITLLITAAWGSVYLRASTRQVLEAVAMAAVAVIPIIAATLWWTRGQLKNVLRWSDGERSPERAAGVWSAAIDLPYRIALRATILTISASPIVWLLTVSLTGVSVGTGAGYLVCGMIGVCGGVVPVLFSVELGLRPLLEDVARFLPADFEPYSHGVRVRTKALLSLPPVTLFSALTVGAFGRLAGDGLGRLMIAVGVAIVTIAVAGAIFWLVMRSLLEPVDRLISATRRVSGGDIETPVPVVSGDELGSLAAGFNQMLGELRRHEQELRDSRARIVAAADDARRRVERDLHDGAQQQLVMLAMKLGMIERQAPADPAAVTAMLPEVRARLAEALRELRDLAHGLYPQRLESEGLPGALRDAAQRCAAPVHVEADGAGRYPPEVEAAVYFCCLEALQNAAKHAGADARASITLAEEGGALRFEVADDGQGFASPDGHPLGAGLQNMADRIGALGGELHVSSRPGAGTTVSGVVPVEP